MVIMAAIMIIAKHSKIILKNLTFILIICKKIRN